MQLKPEKHIFSITHVVTGTTKMRSLLMPLTLCGVKQDIEILALVDSGEMETYIHPCLLIRLWLVPEKLPQPI